MRVLMISKACLVGAYQRKLEAIAAHPGVELTVVVPPEWRDERGVLRLERAHVRGYELVVERMALNGNFHLHFFPGVRRWFERVRPDVAHVDEEPYNLATWHGVRLARRYGAKAIFFSWQNLLRRYPIPFHWMERDVLRRADGAIVGSHDAMAVWRAKGFTGPAVVLPQFGVDPELFAPDGRAGGTGREMTVCYAGRLVPEKGVDLLLRAAALLSDSVRVRIVGAGPSERSLENLAGELGIRGRVTFEGMIPSTRTPALYRQVDVLVLPSRTRPNWKEQFGRVLVEAMACGAVVVGSDSGEIPHVIGDAGRVFPEGDVQALASHLHYLLEHPEARAELSTRGRRRVLDEYTQERIAGETVQMYETVVRGQWTVGSG